MIGNLANYFETYHESPWSPGTVVAMSRCRTVGQDDTMAYIGGNGYLAVWTTSTLKEDKLAESCVLLLGETGEQEEEGDLAAEPSRGFIIQDWFGPFLLGPATRFLRGRC